MKKTVFLILILSLVAVSSWHLEAEDEEILKVESSMSPKRLSRGEEGKVILKVSVKEGITVSPHPHFIIEFSPSEELIFPKNFFTASDTEMEVLEDRGEEYLNLEKPIEIPFTVSLEAKRGVHSLQGKIKYFACNVKEGWCLKTSSKFSVSYSTRQTVVRK